MSRRRSALRARRQPAAKCCSRVARHSRQRSQPTKTLTTIRKESRRIDLADRRRVLFGSCLLSMNSVSRWNPTEHACSAVVGLRSRVRVAKNAMSTEMFV